MNQCRWNESGVATFRFYGLPNKPMNFEFLYEVFEMYCSGGVRFTVIQTLKYERCVRKSVAGMPTAT